MTTAAQKRAQARYDATRPPPLSVRLTEAQLAALDQLRHPGEGRGPALLRLARIEEHDAARRLMAQADG